MTVLRVRGVTDDAAQSRPLRTGAFAQTKVKQAVRLGGDRGSLGELHELQATSDDVLELTLEDGSQIFVSYEQLRQDLGERGSRSGDGVFEMPSTLPTGDRTRGFFGGLVIKGLRLIGFDPGEKLAKLAAGEFAKKVESKLFDGKPGLYRLKLNSAFQRDGDCVFQMAPVRTDADFDTHGHRALIFLHGTGSSTPGSFGGLTSGTSWRLGRARTLQTPWEELVDFYQGHIFGLEHKTLTESPIENACQVLRMLPRNAELDLVSHSRGGLVGEFLCRGQIQRTKVGDIVTAAERKIFQEQGRNEDLALLDELVRLLNERKPKVVRFVRVACPAAGTLLADRRLDRYFSVLTSIVSNIPGLDNPVVEFMTTMALAFAKQRTDPSQLPGLESMMPESPVIRLLNSSGPNRHLENSELAVIAGDIAGGGLTARLKQLTDLYYRENHDLVVNTASMARGQQRGSKCYLFFHKGREVDHFHYFENPATQVKIVDGLKSESLAAAGFEPIAERTATELKTRAPLSAPEKIPSAPTVFLLPGIMGSHLGVTVKRSKLRIWLDFLEIASGGMERLEFDARGVHADEPIGRAYGRIQRRLATRFNVQPFPYDWRLSIEAAADRLATEVRKQLEDSRPPVHLLAHSMGGLVARLMIAKNEDLWLRMKQQGGRLVMLGTPNAGSHTILNVLLGRERVLKQLALADMSHSKQELLGIFARYPGLLEMLPSHDSFADSFEANEGDGFFDEACWSRLHKVSRGGWVSPLETALQSARKIREQLANSVVDPEHMLYVAGNAASTPCGHRLEKGSKGAASIQLLATRRGDGRVTWDSGVPLGISPYFMDASHGELADHEPAFGAIEELLETGKTDRLPRTEPSTRGMSDAPFDLEEEQIDLFPDTEDLERDALGVGEAAPVSDDEFKPLQVSAQHGDLGFSRSAVLVGHYTGDTIVSAEAYIDRELKGALSERHSFKLYPGPLGTAAVFFSGNRTYLPAAVIMGLGPVGGLNASELRRAAQTAALEFAVQRRQRCAPELAGIEKDDDSDPLDAMELTSLLIGTGSGSYLSVEESMRSIIEGVIGANNLLAEPIAGRPTGEIRFGAVQFVELYEDVAVQAAKGLRRLQNDPMLRDEIVAAPMLQTIAGRLRRATFEEAPGWWQRIEVSAEADGALRFVALTQRARAEQRTQPTQRRLIEAFVEEAQKSQYHNTGVAGTLFELLLPNQLKEAARDQGDRVMVVDEVAAAFPWELLEDRLSDSNDPPAVSAGFVRQLKTETFREVVLEALDDSALVVGDPPSSFPPLPGAVGEARHVANLLRGAEYDTHDLIEQSSKPILEELFARPYRILHLAGHGVFEHELEDEKPSGYESSESSGSHSSPRKRTVTGMVLGDGVFLTATEVEQMRRVPELVFLNCCYLGKVGLTNSGDGDWRKRYEREKGRRNKLAANVATQLIKMGVRAVVAAGWAVDDRAALLFAQTFYEEMLDEKKFGDAVRQARKVVYDRFPELTTWGAYQCYGDPAFQLRRSQRRASPGTPTFGSPNELIIDLHNIEQKARVGDVSRAPGLHRDLDVCHEWVTNDPHAKRWMKDRGDVLEAFARAFGELDRFEEAIELYERAERTDDGLCSIHALEQHQNLRVRMWQRIHAASPDRRDEAAEEIEDAIALIQRLLGRECVPTEDEQGAEADSKEYGLSSERLSLLGAAWKRLWMVTGEPEDFRQIGISYQEAYDVDKKNYPLTNLLCARVIGYFREDLRDEGVKNHNLDEVSDWVAEARERIGCGSFWHLADALMCDIADAAVADRDNKKRPFDVAALQLAAQAGKAAQRGSPRELRSMRDHFAWMQGSLKHNLKAGLSRQRRGYDGFTKILAALNDEAP